MTLKQISREELNKHIERHNEWLSSDKKAGEQLRLTAVDLDGTRLENVNLEKAVFVRVSLRRAALRSVNCRGATFKESNLQASTIGRCDFTDANLSESNLSRASIHSTDCTKAYLRAAVLDHSVFTESNLTRVYACNTSGVNSYFTDCNLHRSDWFASDLSETTFQRCNLEFTDFYAANLMNAKFKTSDVALARLVRTNAASIRFEKFNHPKFARLDMGNWPVLIDPYKTMIGCVERPNAFWLELGTHDYDKLVELDDDAPMWWGLFGDAVKAAIVGIMKLNPRPSEETIAKFKLAPWNGGPH